MKQVVFMPAYVPMWHASGIGLLLAINSYTITMWHKRALIVMQGCGQLALA